MLAFCGQERCLLDENGRVKLAQHFIDDFLSRCDGSLVIHGLPEGALAIYPEAVYAEMRRTELAQLDRVASSFAARRSMRRFGALTTTATITRQGRITLPPAFREYAELVPGKELCVIGVEIGVEIWNPHRYLAEMAEIRDHWREKEIREMASDLTIGSSDMNP